MTIIDTFGWSCPFFLNLLPFLGGYFQCLVWHKHNRQVLNNCLLSWTMCQNYDLLPDKIFGFIIYQPK